MTWVNKNAGDFRIYLDRAQSNRVWDIDGSEDVDFALEGTGAMAGHSPGIPMGAYGLRAELADRVLSRSDLDLVDKGGVGGTLVDDPASIAATRATLEHVLTDVAFAEILGNLVVYPRFRGLGDGGGKRPVGQRNPVNRRMMAICPLLCNAAACLLVPSTQHVMRSRRTRCSPWGTVSATIATDWAVSCRSAEP